MMYRMMFSRIGWKVTNLIHKVHTNNHIFIALTNNNNVMLYIDITATDYFRR